MAVVLPPWGQLWMNWLQGHVNFLVESANFAQEKMNLAATGSIETTNALAEFPSAPGQGPQMVANAQFPVVTPACLLPDINSPDAERIASVCSLSSVLPWLRSYINQDPNHYGAASLEMGFLNQLYRASLALFKAQEYQIERAVNFFFGKSQLSSLLGLRTSRNVRTAVNLPQDVRASFVETLIRLDPNFLIQIKPGVAKTVNPLKDAFCLCDAMADEIMNILTNFVHWSSNQAPNAGILVVDAFVRGGFLAVVGGKPSICAGTSWRLNQQQGTIDMVDHINAEFAALVVSFGLLSV